MPAKKKHSKGKGTFKSKQRQPERRVQAPIISQAKPAGVAVQATSAAVASVTQAATPKPPQAPRTMPAKFVSLNIARELRSIAILFAVVLVVMIAVALLFR